MGEIIASVLLEFVVDCGWNCPYPWIRYSFRAALGVLPLVLAYLVMTSKS